ncbi:MAG: sensor histidine kinase [Bacteroidota bacterium]
MRPEANDMIQPLAADNSRKFWRKAFIAYAITEAIFLAATYYITYSQCTYCVLPFGYYTWQWSVNILLTALLWYGLNYFYRWPLLKIITGNIFIFFLYYFLWTGMLYAVLNSGMGFFVWPSIKSVSYENVVLGSWFDIGKYFLKLSAFYVLKFYVEYLKAAGQRIELAVINKDMQLNLLKQQLSPHFYFNTMNNLYGLARSNSPRLSGALSQLSGIMQYVIVDCNQPKVLLRQEINFLHSYIELERLRYEMDTVIELKVEGLAARQTILPLLLIQFVENAFKHGMKEKSDRSWMKVNLDIKDNEVLFRVDNSFYEKTPSPGIGISSVKHILDLQYDGKHDIQMQHVDNRFSVTLKLNLS